MIFHKGERRTTVTRTMNYIVETNECDKLRLKSGEAVLRGGM